MKFHVQLSIPADVGNQFEGREGGPGPVIGRLLERFRPEAVYMAPTERTLFMVADLSDPAEIAELMMACAHIANAYPKFTPVLPGKDFGATLGKAIPGAQKIVNG